MEKGTGRAAIKGKTPARIVRFALVLLACSSTARAGSPPAGQPLGSDVAALEEKIGEKAALGDLMAIAYRSNPMIRAARRSGTASWRGTVSTRPGPTSFVLELLVYPAIYKLWKQRDGNSPGPRPGADTDYICSAV